LAPRAPIGAIAWKIADRYHTNTDIGRFIIKTIQQATSFYFSVAVRVMRSSIRMKLSGFAGSFPRASGALTILVGLWVLAASNLNGAMPQWLLTDQASIKPNTALAFILAGISLWFVQTQSPGRGNRVAAQVCAWATLVIGVLALGEYLFTANFGSGAVPQGRGVSSAGPIASLRISPVTALSLILSSFALLLLTRRKSVAGWLVQLPALAALISPAVALVGYLHKVPTLYTNG
jgi:hypothetical protein